MADSASAGVKRKHEQITDSNDSNTAMDTSDSTSASAAAATCSDAHADGSGASKRARLVAVPLSAGDLEAFAVQAAAQRTNPAWKGARILIDTNIEVLSDGTALVHLDVAFDGQSRRAQKKASRAELTSAKHRDKKAHQKATKKAARAEAAQVKAVEEARLVAEGKSVDEIRAHFRALNALQPHRHKPSTRSAKAHRAELLAQMASNSLQKVIIDCSFDHLMLLQEVCSLAKQIKYIYGHNMRSPKPMHLIVSSLTVPPPDFRGDDGWCMQRNTTGSAAAPAPADAPAAMDATAPAPAPALAAVAATETAAAASSAAAASTATSSVAAASSSSATASAAPRPEMYTRAVLSRLDGFDRLAFDRSESHFTALGNVRRDQLVYLTAESDNVITALDKDKVYVIGGIVDHNRMKGLCHSMAAAAQPPLPTARLPIPEYLVNHRRTVITVNQVFEILLRAQEKEGPVDWAAVLKEVLPARSNWQERTSTAAPGDKKGDEEADEERQEAEDEARNDRLEQQEAAATNEDATEEADL